MTKGPIPSPDQSELGLVAYEADDCSAQFELDAANETVWATQQQIANAFGVDRTVVTRHLRNIFNDGELDEEAVCARIARTASDGKTYQIQHYSLDAILSVGYRVNSKRATAFRRWATQVLRDYITKGYALDKARLRRDPEALRELAAQVRALRADEKARYRAVRDVFAIASVDYDPASPEARAFFAKTQDKFLVAAAGRIASELILDRADHEEPHMGLQCMRGERPTKADVTIGKNYLTKDELYILHMLNEQFLLFVESAAMRGRKLTMADMSATFDRLLTAQCYEVMVGYGPDYLRGKANEHAYHELTLYSRRIAHSPPGSA